MCSHAIQASQEIPLVMITVPCFGGLSDWLLPPADVKTFNDVSDHLVNLYRALSSFSLRRFCPEYPETTTSSFGCAVNAEDLRYTSSSND